MTVTMWPFIRASCFVPGEFASGVMDYYFAAGVRGFGVGRSFGLQAGKSLGANCHGFTFYVTSSFNCYNCYNMTSNCTELTITFINL